METWNTWELCAGLFYSVHPPKKRLINMKTSKYKINYITCKFCWKGKIKYKMKKNNALTKILRGETTWYLSDSNCPHEWINPFIWCIGQWTDKLLSYIMSWFSQKSPDLGPLIIPHHLALWVASGLFGKVSPQAAPEAWTGIIHQNTTPFCIACPVGAVVLARENELRAS